MKKYIAYSFLLFLCFSMYSRLDAVWSTVENVSSPASDVGGNPPSIGRDSQGNAIAIWSNGSTNTIQASTLAVGSSSWSTPVDLPNSLGGSNQQLAVAPTGNAVAVWASSTGPTQSAVFTGGFSGGGTWTATTNNPSFNNDSTFAAQIGIDASGNAIAVWIDGTLGNIVQANTLPASGPPFTWGVPQTISGININQVQLAVSPSGIAVAVWTASSTLQGSRFSSGTWTATTDLSASSAFEPQVVINATNHAVAVWQNSSSAIQGATLDAASSTTWAATTDLTASGESPQVAVDPADNAVAVWQAISSTNRYHVQSAGLPASTLTWVPASADLSTQLTNDDQKVQLDNHGNAIAVWTMRSGNSFVIQASMLPAGGPPYTWSLPETLSEVTTGSDFAQYPQIAIAPDGYAVVDWNHNDANTGMYSIEAVTWTPAPTVTSVAANSGPTTGGNTVTITGTNFIDVSRVTFGVHNATSFTINSTTSINAVVPPNPSDTVDIIITNPDSPSLTQVNDHYTYIGSPTPPPPPTPTPPTPPSPGVTAPARFVGIIEQRSNFKKLKLHHKPSYKLIATWSPSSTPNIASYHIYKNGHFFKKVSGNKYRTFIRRLWHKHIKARYTIRAVSRNGVVSSPTRLTLPK